MSIGLISLIVWGLTAMSIQADIRQTKYKMSEICDDTVYGSVIHSLTTINAIACGSECGAMETCTSFTFDNETSSCVHNNGRYGDCYTGTPFCARYIKYGTIEASCCTQPVSDVRLCDGDGLGICNPSKGRLEVNVGNVWGTVCDDFWNDEHTYYDNYDDNDRGFTNADVVCAMLGFTSGIPRPNGYFTCGSGPIWMDGTSCDGTESHLFLCSFNGFGANNCGHNEDVGVECV